MPGGGYTNRQTYGQTDSDRHTHRDTHTDTDTHTHTHTHTHILYLYLYLQTFIEYCKSSSEAGARSLPP